MKVGIGVLALSMVGCVIVDDDSSNRLLPGEIDVSWELYAGFPGEPVDCVAGDRILVLVRPSAGGEELPHCIDCRRQSVVLPPLPPDIYDVTVQLTDGCDDGALILAQSDTVPDVDVIDTGAIVDTQFDIDGGYFQMSWSFDGASLEDGCNAAGAMKVEVLPSEADDPSAIIEPTQFDCIAGVGEVAKLFAPETYHLQIDLVDEFGDIIPGFTQDRLDQNLTYGNEQPAVMHVTFPTP